MKKALIVAILIVLATPAFARANHAGWHGAAPLHRMKMKQRKHL